MAIELQFWSIIIPIENINKCKSLGGFEKFIMQQKDRIGYDVWYDEYLYRYRVPHYKDPEIYEFWKQQGLQPLNKIDGKSDKSEWKDLCLATESGPSLKCDWLEVDEEIPCAWLKGKPRGEIYGSKRRNSKVISESTIDPKYYVDFFEKLYRLHDSIRSIPEKLHKAYNFKHFVEESKPTLDIPLKFYIIYPFWYLIYLILIIIANVTVKLLPKFDVKRFLDMFDLIKLDEGYTLDYEYYGDHPVVYTRRKNQIYYIFRYLFRSKTANVEDALGPFRFEAIENISFEQSPEGFFQFAVFSVAVHQFYLYWHACENDEVFIYTRSQIDEILKTILKSQYERVIRLKIIEYLSNDEMEEKVDQEISVLFNNKKSDDDISTYLGPLMEGEAIDQTTGKISTIEDYWTSEEELIALFNASLHPQVIIMENGYGIVKILSFSKWGGFTYQYSCIRWPNLIEKVPWETVLDYNCGIIF